MHVRNLLNIKQELLYQVNPITAITIIAEYHNTVYAECGLSRCNECDEWDPETGVRVAKRRALRKIEEVVKQDERENFIAEDRRLMVKLNEAGLNALWYKVALNA